MGEFGGSGLDGVYEALPYLIGNTCELLGYHRMHAFIDLGG